jgi:hypothetical protein
MNLQVTAIEFDFETEDDALTVDEQQQVIDSVLGKVYEVTDTEDEDLQTYELLEAISNETGWCIHNLDYSVV